MPRSQITLLRLQERQSTGPTRADQTIRTTRESMRRALSRVSWILLYVGNHSTAHSEGPSSLADLLNPGRGQVQGACVSSSTSWGGGCQPALPPSLPSSPHIPPSPPCYPPTPPLTPPYAFIPLDPLLLVSNTQQDNR